MKSWILCPEPVPYFWEPRPLDTLFFQNSVKFCHNSSIRLNSTKTSGLFLALALSVGLVTSASAAPVEAPKNYLIVLPSQDKAHSDAVVAAGGRVIQSLNNIDTLIVSIPARAAERLAAARPDWVVGPDMSVSLASTETQTPTKSWGQDRVDQVSLPLDASYSYPTSEQGSRVTAYVLDTGIRLDHTEFVGRVRLGYQGYIDTSGAGDCQGHGTHVAGTIGGSTVGIAKKVNLVAVSILDCSGSGSLTVIAQGADWMIADHVSGPAVANMSLGMGANSTLDAIVSKIVADGITVVVAAGNDSADACRYSPARVSSAITVGSTMNDDSRSSFSNFGSCVDIFAPGSDIYSSYKNSSTGYAILSGTSMASPAVAGVAARFLSAYPNASPDSVWAALNSSANLGKIFSAGTGSPNKLLFASSAGYLTVAPEQPGPVIPNAPSFLTSSKKTKNSVSLNWGAPVSTITGYALEVSTNSSFSTTVQKLSYLASTTSSTVTGLKARTTYYFRIAAVNSTVKSTWVQLSVTTAAR